MNSTVHFSSATDQWNTPDEFYQILDDEYHFTLDPCTDGTNSKCSKYYTKEQDGLAQDWSGERVFMNPPYGRDISKWVKKAHDSDTLTVCLLPARTDTTWWHDFIMGGAQRYGISKDDSNLAAQRTVLHFRAQSSFSSPRTGQE